MLKGDGIHLRHVAEADLDALWPLINDLELRGDYLPSVTVSEGAFRQQYRENGFSSEEYERLLIVDDAGTLLGTTWHFKSVPYFNAREIGYILFRQGLSNTNIVSRAVALLVDHLFKARLLNRLEIRMDVRNLASEKVAIKCGFTKEGVARGANFVQGDHVDMAVYALLRDEWRAMKGMP